MITDVKTLSTTKLDDKCVKPLFRDIIFFSQAVQFVEDIPCIPASRGTAKCYIPTCESPRNPPDGSCQFPEGRPRYELGVAETNGSPSKENPQDSPKPCTVRTPIYCIRLPSGRLVYIDRLLLPTCTSLIRCTCVFCSGMSSWLMQIASKKNKLPLSSL
ncbi:hypothetical protein ASPZODRAFT_128707 [Penicilliopsis zonata CBS 506.65]|uniref:Uncharacterized protein n=1 Tax=Penicilliopsis zonata CBS 506.65 TaxID=1073090 RepID=A0A1L9SSC0_9EURO|nr:hypothetical protein ASPZODRAFT_128707 [Penicilliopsis zonata CBS 506.65]OJJ50100.1 hypothetical protein ASPZODRAFT_128707 [Penicilliopsis zonata CBS 506.65]